MKTVRLAAEPMGNGELAAIWSNRIGTSRPAAISWRSLRGCTAYLTALAIAVAPVMAQPGQNIAGTYRGLMTSCLTVARSADCRKGFNEMIRLADEVDAKRVEWERTTAVGGEPGPSLQKNYEQALERLNRAVADFNRDMSATTAEARQQ